MGNEIIRAFDSISTVNQLIQYKKVTIGNLLIEINGTVNSIREALIIKHVLCLLEQAGKFKNMTRPIYIANWIIVTDITADVPYKRDYKDDSIDAMRYSVEVMMKQPKGIIPEETARELLSDLTEPKVVNKKATKIPASFIEDMDVMKTKDLMVKYSRSKSCIDKWKQTIRRLKNESSK